MPQPGGAPHSVGVNVGRLGVDTAVGEEIAVGDAVADSVAAGTAVGEGSGGNSVGVELPEMPARVSVGEGETLGGWSIAPAGCHPPKKMIISTTKTNREASPPAIHAARFLMLHAAMSGGKSVICSAVKTGHCRCSKVKQWLF
jgi:hypothetical protein